MNSQSSVSTWIADLKAKDAEAVQKLWKRYAQRLVQLAEKKLGDVPRRMADEEDIAQCVFTSLCRGAAEGRLETVTNRDELWWLLVGLTRQKIVDYVRRETAQKRGGGKVLGEADIGADTDQESVSPQLDRLIGEQPTPEFLMALQERYNHLLGLLRDDRLRTIACLRIEGYTVDEIASHQGVSRRSVERKLQLIRSHWAKEFQA